MQQLWAAKNALFHHELKMSFGAQSAETTYLEGGLGHFCT